MEALKERGLLLQNAPHLVHDLAFVVPNYEWWEAPFYGMGLKLYQLLAGKYGFGKSRLLSREETLEQLPTINTDGLRGGAVYYDGQFDDARLLIHMALTAYENGAALLNYVEVTGLTKDAQGFVDGVIARDAESISSGERGDSAFTISQLVERSRQRGFEQAAIANSVGATEERQLLGMEIKNDIDIEPFRLVHFASALYVSAYLRNERRASSIALACFGSYGLSLMPRSVCSTI